MQGDWSLQFHPADNEQIIAYSKMTDDLLNIIVVVVNLDPSAHPVCVGRFAAGRSSTSIRASPIRCTIC